MNEVFEKLVEQAYNQRFFFADRRHKMRVGEMIARLTPGQRAQLQTLCSQHTWHRLPSWHY